MIGTTIARSLSSSLCSNFELLTLELFPTGRKAMCPWGIYRIAYLGFLHPLRPAQRACRLGHVLMPFAWL